MTRLLIAVLLAALPLAAQAAVSPRPVDLDPRIQTVDYDPDQVVMLQGQLGYQMMLEFGEGERIENVAIGDALGWQVTPNRKANLLFLKPLDRLIATNMTVVTSQRRYSFELRVAPKASRTVTPYSIRFAYAPVAVALPMAPVVIPEPEPVVANQAYAVTGSPENTPARIFDDGRMTYFEFPAEAAIPAIFAVDAEGAESLVNSGMRGQVVVVQQLSPRFVLRNGKQVTQVINRGYGQAVARSMAEAKSGVSQ
ncbi:MAG: P-type conjugative transfer protein VirB9 [Caulobacter sp.]|nr:P-type conjugative transfer protein VirB9 [Caulobacter sp.]